MTENELSKEIDKLEEKIDRFAKKLDKQIQTANLINKMLASALGLLFFLIFFSFIQIGCTTFPEIKSLPICVVK